MASLPACDALGQKFAIPLKVCLAAARLAD
jgi:hypothetical protein